MTSPASKLCGRLIEAAGPGHEVVDAPRRQQRAVRVASTDFKVFGNCHDAAGAQIGGSASIGPQTDLRRASDGRNRRFPFVQPLGFVEIGDAFFGHKVRDVVSVDHDRRQRHAGLLAHLDSDQGVDNGRSVKKCWNFDRQKRARARFTIRAAAFEALALRTQDAGRGWDKAPAEVGTGSGPGRRSGLGLGSGLDLGQDQDQGPGASAVALGPG